MSNTSVPNAEGNVTPTEGLLRNYADKGWQYVACRPATRTPLDGLTGGKVGFLSADEVAAVIDGSRSYFLSAIRPPVTVIGFDVDHYGNKTGGDTLEKAQAALGELPPTYSLTARGPDQPSRRLWYRIPADLIIGDAFFKPYGGDIETIRTGHRFTWAPPTNHHRTGTPVLWYAPDGTRSGSGGVDGTPDVADLPDLPARWIEAAQTLSEARSEVRDGLVLGEAEPMSRHAMDSAVATSEGSVRDGIGSWGGDFRSALWGWAANYTRRAIALGEDIDGAHAAAGELFADAGEVVEAADAQHITDGIKAAMDTPWALEAGITPLGSGRIITPTVDPYALPANPTRETDFLLPLEFWEQTPFLQHVFRFARIERACPDAVLHSALAIVAAHLPHTYRIETGLGECGLSFYTANVGPSGTGKTKAWKTARKMLKVWTDGQRSGVLGHVVEGSPSTGEGLVEAFMVDIAIPETDAEGKEVLKADGTVKYSGRKEKVQKHHNALLTNDEARGLLQLAAKSGSIVFPVLSAMWSGTNPGQLNTKENARSLEEDSYTLGLVLGFQVANADDLFVDHNGGTPQRFTFTPSRDPRHEMTASQILAMRKARRVEAASFEMPWIPPVGTVIELSEAAMLEVIQADIDRDSVAEEDMNELAPHHMQVRARMAALLSLLDGEHQTVSDRIWAISGLMLERSAALGDWLKGRAQREQAKVAKAKRDDAVKTAKVTEQETHAQRLIREVYDSISEKVDAAEGKRMNRRDLKKAIKQGERRDAFDDALAMAVRKGSLREVTEGRSVFVEATDSE